NIVKSYNHSSYLDQELKVTQSGIVEKRLSLSVLGDSGATVQDLAQHAGYYRIENTVDARMFYFFFESRRAKSDPVVIWLTGGPGCSSELALFYENGPFKVTKNLSLVWNDYGWDQVSNLIYVDQPTGTGFSYSSSDQDIRHDETGVSNDLYFFLQAFFKAHPDYAIKECGTTGTTSCITALDTCQPIFEDILQVAGNINYYDIRKQCEGELCYDFSNMENFLSESSVKTALGVPSGVDFVSCSGTVHEAMLQDWMRDLEVGIPALLEQGIELLVYAGEYDLICNWVGNSRWVNAMPWSGQNKFVAASNVSFVVDGKEAGIMKTYGPLTFLKVHNAGHMVPMDQPSAALQMLQLWTTGKLTPPKRR
nr:serine carboxypeptidase-like [Tanacetum cinerariifolium]